MNADFVFRVQELQRTYPEMSADEAEEMVMRMMWVVDSDPLLDALTKTNPLADLAEMIRQRDRWHAECVRSRILNALLLAALVVMVISALLSR